jgi:hypothetical protein
VATPAYRKQSGPLVFALSMIGFGLLYLVLRPGFDQARDTARLSECRTNLEMIASHQAGLREARGGYVACPTWPTITPTEAVLWEEAPPCWVELGFQRDVQLRGQYRVDATMSGFEATCAIDLDGDGDTALFRATHELTTRQDPAHED